jgi:hypothetical protein
VPPELRTNAGLEAFFRRCVSTDAVLETRLGVFADNLCTTMQKRTAAIANLENAIALEEVTGIVPTHNSTLFGGERVNSIEVCLWLCAERMQLPQ